MIGGFFLFIGFTIWTIACLVTGFRLGAKFGFEEAEKVAKQIGKIR